MNTHLSLLRKTVGLIFVGSAVSVGLGQYTLIDTSTKNGSFEDGVLAPWGSGHDVQVEHDPAFSSDGAYYASFQSSLVRPVMAGQNLKPDPLDGFYFSLTFDARTGGSGFDSIRLDMGGRTPDGGSVSAGVEPVLTPALSAESWQSYHYELQMPAVWDEAGVFLGIGFSSDEPLGGIPHYAYLDNVVLTQIPEPSAFALLGVGGLCLCAGLFCGSQMEGSNHDIVHSEGKTTLWFPRTRPSIRQCHGLTLQSLLGVGGCVWAGLFCRNRRWWNPG